MTAADVRLLFEYNAWANRLLMNAASRLSAEQFVHDMGASFGSVRSTLLHIVMGEWRWLQFWLEEPFDHDFPPVLRQLGHEPPTTDFLAFPDSA